MCCAQVAGFKVMKQEPMLHEDGRCSMPALKHGLSSSDDTTASTASRADPPEDRIFVPAQVPCKVPWLSLSPPPILVVSVQNGRKTTGW